MIDERVLGGVRFLDAVTRQPIDRLLRIESDAAVKWTHTRRGIYAVRVMPGLDGADVTARNSAVPESLALNIVVHDPARQYLSCRHTLRLPRDPDPTHEQNPGSLFRPVDVLLFPAPVTTPGSGWAVVRATTIPHALVRVLRAVQNQTTHLGSALADDRGEVFVGVIGIPATSFNGGNGPVTSPGADVTLEVVVDPNAATPPDPFDLEQRHAALLVRTIPLRLVPGRVLVETL